MAGMEEPDWRLPMGGDETSCPVYLSPLDLRYSISAAGSSLMIASTPASISICQICGVLAVQGTTWSPAACEAFTCSGVTSSEYGEIIVAPASLAISTNGRGDPSYSAASRISGASFF